MSRPCGTFYGQAMTAGHIYTVAGGGQTVGGDGGPATQAALGTDLGGVRVDPAGNLVFADTTLSRIRVLATTSGTFYGHAMKAGDIYTVAGDGKPAFAGDGGLATEASIAFPGDVAVDSAGDLAIADNGNQRARFVPATSGTFYGQAMRARHIYTVAVVAAKTGTFYGVPMTAGNIDTVAGTGITGFSGDGGPGVHAALDFPTGIVATGKGLLIIDNRRVRMISG
jgi:trimeric autotransporter adhesin